jgi:hypothetical protein
MVCGEACDCAIQVISEFLILIIRRNVSDFAKGRETGPDAETPKNLAAP